MSKQSENKGPLGDKFNDFEFTPSSNLFDEIQNGLASDPKIGALSEKFNAFSPDVSEKIWPKIEKELHSKNKRRAIIWWGAAAIFIVGFGIGNLLNTNDDLSETIVIKNIVVDDPAEVEQKNAIKASNSKKEIIAHESSDSKITTSKSITSELFEQDLFGNVVNESSDLMQAKNSYVSKEGVELEVIEYKEITIEEKRLILDDSQNSLLFKDLLTNLAFELLEEINKKKSTKNISKHTFASLAGSFRGNSGIDLNSDKEYAYNAASFTSSDIEYSEEGMAEFSEDIALASPQSSNSLNDPTINSFSNDNSLPQEEQFEAQYKDYVVPTTIGALYQRNFSNQLSLASGILYTRIGYSYKKEPWSMYNRKGQDEYISIPINLTFDLIKNSKFDLYPLIGSQIDFGLQGKDEIKNQDIDSGKLKLDKIRPGNLISVLTGIGTSYDFTKKFSLFGQTIVQYYPITSEYSYFSQKPLNISFQGGIKFSF